MRLQLVTVALIVGLIGVSPVDAADLTGSVPSGPVVVLHGQIFGATEYGGPNCPRRTNLDVAGCGVVYEADLSGKITVLHAFSGDDGANPSSGVAAGPDGTLYGTTDAGGGFGHGVVYHIAADGTGFQVLHSFSTGSEHGTLTIGKDGTVYGVAPPSHGDGHGASIFSLSQSGEFRTLRVFGPETHVEAPLAVDDSGELFGIVIRGGFCGGDVFSLSGTGAYGMLFSNTLPYTDARCAKTVIPTSPLVDDEGTFYATDRSAIYRVTSRGFEPLFSLPKSEATTQGWIRRFERIILDGSMIASPDGALTVAVSASFHPRDCGRIVRFDPSDGKTSVDILQGDVHCIEAAAGRRMPSAIAYVGGSMYDVVDQGEACSGEPPMPAFCGAVLKVGREGSQVVATFDLPDPPLAASKDFAPSARAQMSTSSLPGSLSMSVLVESPKAGPFFARTGTSRLALLPADEARATPIPLTFAKSVWKVDTPGQSSQFWTGQMSLRVRSIPAGMYQVDVSHFNPVVSDADGYQVSMDQGPTVPIYIPPAPRATPALHPGQRFIEFAQPAGVPPFSIPGLRVRTLKTVAPIEPDGRRLTFAVDDGSSESLTTKSDSVFGLDGLTPIVDDSDVDYLDDRYAGRDVHPIGDFVPVCLFPNGMSGGLGADPHATYRIRSIVRLSGVSAIWGIGSWTLHTVDSSADYDTSSPILVAFDGRRDNGVLADPPFAGHGCAVAYAEFSGSWDFERFLSLQGIFAKHPEWSATDLDRIAKHDIVAGMTRDMVIAAFGYPSAYGTAAQMMKLDTWNYEMPAPFAYTVHFKGDRVVKYDPPGQLP